jgi:hypothetical protein
MMICTLLGTYTKNRSVCSRMQPTAFMTFYHKYMPHKYIIYDIIFSLIFQGATCRNIGFIFVQIHHISVLISGTIDENTSYYRKNAGFSGKFSISKKAADCRFLSSLLHKKA